MDRRQGRSSVVVPGTHASLYLNPPSCAGSFLEKNAHFLESSEEPLGTGFHWGFAAVLPPR